MKGLHLNMFAHQAPYGPLSYITGYFMLPPFEWKKIFPLKKYILFLLQESGYMHIQGKLDLIKCKLLLQIYSQLCVVQYGEFGW